MLTYKKICLLTSALLLCSQSLLAQDTEKILEKVKAKLAGVTDYQAEGIMKTDVSFMKVPESKVTVYFKKPDRFKIKKQDGISIVPKGGVNINLSSLFSDNRYTAVAAGTGTVHNVATTIIKLLPLDEKSEVVVSTLYIDEKESLIRKTVITTRENGTYEMELDYGKYASHGLPDKIVFIFATKDFKLPKGLTFDYDSGEKPRTTNSDQKGKIAINYTSYTINKGISDEVFR
jgi:outer membrane lipoprotein-sorting protein